MIKKKNNNTWFYKICKKIDKLTHYYCIYNYEGNLIVAIKNIKGSDLHI